LIVAVAQRAAAAICGDKTGEAAETVEKRGTAILSHLSSRSTTGGDGAAPEPKALPGRVCYLHRFQLWGQKE
jgi:hypothetical protein